MNINQVWPEWNEDCVLGEGSFGKVYRAKRVEYGRTFYSAIKVISVPKNQQEIKAARQQGMSDTDIYNYFHGLVENLLNEITLMDNLKGAKNVVGIEDYKIIEREGEIGWDIFIRMELLTPFDSFVSNPEFSQLDVIRLGVDICSALEVCEQNYIVHRDIKPDNIFISRFGEYKLGDFGIARKLETTQANLSRKGTLNYMAPEVYKSEAYTSNVDIYSLGLVLYSLLNNNRIAFLPPYPQPITYSDNEQALSMRLSGLPMPPPCNATAALGAVILKACAYRADERYQSATEFKNALLEEWNVIAASGMNVGIGVGTAHFGSNVEQNVAQTTGDMTAGGRVLVDGYIQETMVLDSSSGGGYTPASYSGSFGAAGEAPADYYPRAKSSKLARILAWPMAIGVCVCAILLLLADSVGAIERTCAISLLSVGLSILITDTNRRAVGLSVAALSLSYVTEGLGGLIGGIMDGIPVDSVVVLVSGLLMLFGGIVILFQREVRFGGSLCIYALVAEWLYHIYGMINHTFSVEKYRIFFGACAVAVLLWSYGYNSEDKPRAIRKWLFILSYILSAWAVYTAVTFTVRAFA